jgi:hypothetical protein
MEGVFSDLSRDHCEAGKYPGDLIRCPIDHRIEPLRESMLTLQPRQAEGHNDGTPTTGRP